MGNFSIFNKQVEQRSHHPLDLTNAPSPSLAFNASHTLDQLTRDGQTLLEIRNLHETIPVSKAVADFVNQNPLAIYNIDGEANVDQSIICTQKGPSKTCLNLRVNSIELFRTMQCMEFRCLLPDHANATCFECRKIQ